MQKKKQKLIRPHNPDAQNSLNSKRMAITDVKNMIGNLVISREKVIRQELVSRKIMKLHSKK
jgi:hypothetical protein